jgi:hypothetical protein
MKSPEEPAAFAADAGLETLVQGVPAALQIVVVDSAVDGTLTVAEVKVNDAVESYTVTPVE